MAHCVLGSGPDWSVALVLDMPFYSMTGIIYGGLAIPGGEILRKDMEKAG